MPIPILNIDTIKTELKELAGKHKITVKTHKGYRLKTIETDDRTTILINPRKIKTEKQFDMVMETCRRTLTYGVITKR